MSIVLAACTTAITQQPQKKSQTLLRRKREILSNYRKDQQKELLLFLLFLLTLSLDLIKQKLSESLVVIYLRMTQDSRIFSVLAKVKQFWIMELLIAQRKACGMATLREAAPTLVSESAYPYVGVRLRQVAQC